MKQALQAGDISFCFPISYDWDEPAWEALPYKLLKEIRQAVTDYGPTSPYTLTLVEGLAAQWMTPYDWNQVAKACLTGGNYLLWKTEYEDLAKQEVNKPQHRLSEIVARTRTPGPGVPLCR